MRYKINNPQDCESIKVVISKETYPILFKQKVDELVDIEGMDIDEAEEYVEGMEIDLELCYSYGNGLFGIESEAIDSLGSSLFNPYTAESLIDCDECDDEISDRVEFSFTYDGKEFNETFSKADLCFDDVVKEYDVWVVRFSGGDDYGFELFGRYDQDEERCYARELKLYVNDSEGTMIDTIEGKDLKYNIL